MLVSPAEPPELKTLGTVSSITERYGADFIILSPTFGRVGVQRKELKDLIASLADGRVEREIWQQRALDQAIWLIEGRPQWTSDGALLNSSTQSGSYTKTSHLGVCLSLLSSGCWILNSSSLTDSAELLSALNRWLLKQSHTSLLRRPSAPATFGKDLKDEQIHVMQGFNRVGYAKAKAIVEEFGGLPFELTGDLTKVRGIGKGIDREVRRVLGLKGEEEA